ncbi:NAD(P)/FAD-dependent oxidoreductase [Robertkochia aurantiaca]|uniref:NAD(P)/FAD-dependent oxidoreductase n=1 Tax=Robertkochia aurantiaca TaxID=2873700 RepID=UPI001CC9F459|nr:NAD(P)/FAD-dependent oxidoreductase [Robertkochia sp. 3YJGBD-33]
MNDYQVVIVGGGAAGFFAAIHIARRNSGLRIAILERGKDVLNKVRISGGGRCNVTHAEFVPAVLTTNYPRGEKELLGPFHQYCSGDTVQFFEELNVPLKTEDDGRMFPVSDSSASIIDCLTGEARRLGIHLITADPVQRFYPTSDHTWNIETRKNSYTAQRLLLATGSNSKVWDLLHELGHSIIPPVPSLFTFNCKSEVISNLAGVSTEVGLKVEGTTLESEGPLLITHWGFSGPGVLRLSAWGARTLNELNYEFALKINWIPGSEREEVEKQFEEIRKTSGKKNVGNTRFAELPRRLWLALLSYAEIDLTTRWGDLKKDDMLRLSEVLTSSHFDIRGKSTFKEEFVTAGGVSLKEVDFRTFGSRKLPGLYFAGEILNIDAITGGFNFQNAWTGAYIAARAIAASFG